MQGRHTCVLKGGITFNSPSSTDIFLYQPNAHDSAHQQDRYNNRHYDGGIWRGLSLGGTKMKLSPLLRRFLIFQDVRVSWVAGPTFCLCRTDQRIRMKEVTDADPAQVRLLPLWLETSLTLVARNLPVALTQKEEDRHIQCNPAVPGCFRYKS